ncbi:hypothetical protein NDU88_003230 [Pleurodeles waltl]|uniref:Orn/DAP/Arg decarboxylase 2 N-terminal domain-containing protein n=1 Tax=Pleurodeles waltl TaxID=8319 RepID=A0AAV7TNG0_PLEWA|nr:hypothetical protein NDU88_003230 [Pleurodeles waltl]
MRLCIPAGDSSSILKFSTSFEDCRHLLELAKSLGVEVIGISFHVVTGCQNPQIFTHSIADARLVFAMAEKLGCKMHVLDIGGGFPGTEDGIVCFEEFADVTTSALNKYFPENCRVEVITEPGRYYVESAFLLPARIIGKKDGVEASCGK